jgi:hypothetical protein
METPKFQLSSYDENADTFCFLFWVIAKLIGFEGFES